MSFFAWPFGNSKDGPAPVPDSLMPEAVAEMQSRGFPGERLMVCLDPCLREERRRKREELLAATEETLERIARSVPALSPGSRRSTAASVARPTGRGPTDEGRGNPRALRRDEGPDPGGDQLKTCDSRPRLGLPAHGPRECPACEGRRLVSEWRENGRRTTRSLGHRDWTRAKIQADEVAAAGPIRTRRRRKARAAPRPLTLKTLFDIYGEEVTSTKAEATRKRDAVCMRMFLGFFGGHRNPATLSQIDWDRFIRERRSGQVGQSGKPASNATIAADLAFLITVFNWATRSRDEHGRLLLQSNPLKGLKKPVQKNPRRVLVTELEYEALLGVSLEVNWRFHVALVLAHETGHRIGAIRQLRWSDIDFEGRAIWWRAEHEKTGYGHVTPATAEAIAVLEEARKRNRGIGDAPVLPHTKDPSKCITHSNAARWWRKACRLAGLEPKRGRGWHSLRRKFASDLMDQPLKVLCELGGWKTAQTVLQCYQRADQTRLRKALEHRTWSLS